MGNDAMVGLYGLMMLGLLIVGTVLGHLVAGPVGTTYGFIGGIVVGLVAVSVVSWNRTKVDDDDDDDDDENDDDEEQAA